MYGCHTHLTYSDPGTAGFSLCLADVACTECCRWSRFNNPITLSEPPSSSAAIDELHGIVHLGKLIFIMCLSREQSKAGEGWRRGEMTGKRCIWLGLTFPNTIWTFIMGKKFRCQTADGTSCLSTWEQTSLHALTTGDRKQRRITRSFIFCYSHRLWELLLNTAYEVLVFFPVITQ